MKIGLFTDTHYCTKETLFTYLKPSLSYEKLQEALWHFKSENVELIICLGDFIQRDDNEKQDILNLKNISNLLISSGIKCYCCMGNHDREAFSKEEFENISKIKTSPLTFVKTGKRFILLDANYSKDGTTYQKQDIDWTDTNIPPEQIEWFENILSTCQEDDIYIFVHQNLDPEIDNEHMINNAKEIREIINRSDNVRAVYQGHYHAGAYNLKNKTPYITLKSMCVGLENSFMVIDI